MLCVCSFFLLLLASGTASSSLSGSHTEGPPLVDAIDSPLLNDQIKCDGLLLTEESKDAEVKKLLEMKDLELEEMKTRLKNQEKERQSELLQLQMEVSEQLHRVSSRKQKS